MRFLNARDHALTALHLPDSHPHAVPVPVTIADRDAPDVVRTVNDPVLPRMMRRITHRLLDQSRNHVPVVLNFFTAYSSFMPYRFEESDDEPQVQPHGGGRREPPRNGIRIDQLDAPESQSPQPSPVVSKSAAILGLIVFGGGVLLLVAQLLLSFIHR